MTGRWLALDTATELASVAVGVPPATVSVVTLTGARLQAAEIIELVDRCLTPLGVRPAHLAGIVVGDGPGSFTGLRVGWAAAKGLAQEHGLPLRTIPSLFAAAAGAATVLGSVAIGVCFDALRGQVYGTVATIFPTHLETLVAPRVCTISELIEATPLRPRVVVSDGAAAATREIEDWTGAPPLTLAQLRPVAASLLDLSARSGVGRVLENLVAAEPDYGRPAEAQARWEARHGRPLPNPSRSSG